MTSNASSIQPSAAAMSVRRCAGPTDVRVSAEGSAMVAIAAISPQSAQQEGETVPFSAAPSARAFTTQLEIVPRAFYVARDLLAQRFHAGELYFRAQAI